MSFFVLVEGNEAELQEGVVVLNQYGTNHIGYNQLHDALLFINEIPMQHMILIIDLQLFLDEPLEDIEAVVRLSKRRKSCSVFFLTALPEEARQVVLPIIDFAKGIIERPLTISKLKALL